MPKTAIKTPDPMEEKREHTVSVTLGITHYEALRRWSKKQFGRENLAGFLAILIDEKFKAEQASRTEESLAR